jgi:hypothetical protein
LTSAPVLPPGSGTSSARPAVLLEVDPVGLMRGHDGRHRRSEAIECVGWSSRAPTDRKASISTFRTSVDKQMRGKRFFCMKRRWFLWSSGALVGVSVLGSGDSHADHIYSHNGPAASLPTECATRFLAALNTQQRARATFSFDTNERLNWHYSPHVQAERRFSEFWLGGRTGGPALVSSCKLIDPLAESRTAPSWKNAASIADQRRSRRSGASD